MSDRLEATVITPAYNEEQALPGVLAALALLKGRGIKIVVVDDGSTDRTAAVAREAGYDVVRLPRNVGKAGAVRAGLAAAIGDKVVVIDADGTYPADAIPEIIRLLDDFDIVLGSRIEGRGHIPALNRFGNAALRKVIHLFSGFRSADPLTGLYGLRRNHLEAMQLRSRGFGLEAEICVKAARMGLRAADLPIRYGERIGDSKLHPVRDGLVIAWTIIRALFSGPRVRPPPERVERVRPAPLAIVATVASLALLTISAIILVPLWALSVASLVDPRIPLTAAVAVPGIVALASGAVLWRLAHRWGRPGPGTLAPLAAAAVAAGAVAVGGLVLSADALGVLPRTPGISLTGRALVLASGVALLAAPLALVIAPRVAAGESPALVPVSDRTGPGRAEVVGLIAILALFALPVLRFIAIGPLFGFDEAIYASTARSWVEGTPNTAWAPHRSPGISLLGLPAVPFGSVEAFRLVGMVFGLALVVATWALGRRLGGPAAGLLGAVGVASVPELRTNAAFFLTDVPSAAILLGLMFVAWTQLEECPVPTRSVLWLAPIAAAAFYVRYGASIPILLVGVTALVLWWKRIVAGWRLAAGTLALLFVLLVPHFVQSTLQLGTPWAIAMSAQSLASPEYPGQALITYLRLLPGGLAGPVGGLLIMLGIGAWPAILMRERLASREARAHTYLSAPALLQVLLLGVVALAGVRYVLLPIVLLLVAGSIAAVRIGDRMTASWRRTLAWVLAGSVVTTGLASAAVDIRRQADHAPTQRDLVDVATAIRDDANGRSCSVLGYPPPQIIWYSGCATHHFGYPPRPGAERGLSGDRRYLVLATSQYPDRYPAGALRAGYAALAEPEPMATVRDHVSGAVEYEVYRIPSAP